MPDSPLEILVRWEQHGARWRVRHQSDRLAVIDLCTCDGEAVDELRSSDRELLRYLASRGLTSEEVERGVG